MPPRYQIIQQVEYDLDAIGGNRLLDEQFGAVGKTGRAVAFRGVAGHYGDFDAGITPDNDAEQLDAVHHRYPDVQHDEVHRRFLQDGQRPVRGRGGINFPGLAGQHGTQFAERFQQGHAVVHEQHVIFFGRFAAASRRAGRLGVCNRQR